MAVASSDHSKLILNKFGKDQEYTIIKRRIFIKPNNKESTSVISLQMTKNLVHIFTTNVR